jgi:hypothetical protein
MNLRCPAAQGAWAAWAVWAVSNTDLKRISNGCPTWDSHFFFFLFNILILVMIRAIGKQII